MIAMEYVKIISEEKYNFALKRLKVIFHAPIGSKEHVEAETLVLLIESYENVKYPIL